MNEPEYELDVNVNTRIKAEAEGAAEAINATAEPPDELGHTRTRADEPGHRCCACTILRRELRAALRELQS